MHKKYLFFDYDGTLTDKKTTDVVPSSLKALDELQANGHFVALCTGRAHHKARIFMEKLHLHNMVCCGGEAFVINDELIKNEPLNADDVKQLLRECEDNNIGWQLSISDTPEIYSDSDLFDRQCDYGEEETGCIIDPDFNFENVETIMKAYISVSKEDEYKLPALKKLGYLRFVPGYIIIQHDNKKKGIIDLMNAINAPLEDVVVFGDDRNDIIMFDKRWTSIAVGNACDDLKQVADYVTDNSYDDGIYKACKKFGWI